MSLRIALPLFASSFLAVASLAGCVPLAVDAAGNVVTDSNGDGIADGEGDTVSSADEALSACAHNDGKANRNIPKDNVYYMTAFGGPQDTSSNGTMSCGGKADGKSFYIADRQRFETGGRCGGAAGSGASR